MIPAKILVVEDDLVIQENLAALLADEGYEVVCASNGQEALELLSRSGMPRLILLDLMMPVMSGWELRAKLLQNDQLAQIPVVILSAVSDLRDQANTLAAAAYVEKPIALDALFSCVQQLLMNPGLHQIEQGL